MGTNGLLNKTKLAVFDLDGTLMDTPLPEEGKLIYKEKSGKDWPYQGWWGRELSLDMDIFDIQPIASVIVDYEKQKTNKSTVMVMLTGRRFILKDSVIKILDAHSLEFDEYHFNRGGATEVAKMNTITELLAKYPNVTEVELWDDRLEHIPIFKEFGDALVKKSRLKNFHINVVDSFRH